MNPTDSKLFPPLGRRYFGIAINGNGEPVLTTLRTTVEAAVRDMWELPYPTGEAGMCVFSIDHDEEEIRVEHVPDAPLTDDVAEAAKRMVAGEATPEDFRFFPPLDDLLDRLPDETDPTD